MIISAMYRAPYLAAGCESIPIPPARGSIPRPAAAMVLRRFLLVKCVENDCPFAILCKKCKLQQ